MTVETRFLTADHIALQGAGYEPQRSANFTLQVVGLPGSTGGSGDDGPETILRLSLREVPIPFVKLETTEVPYGNEVRYVPGKAKVAAVTFKFNDFVDVDVARILTNWLDLVYKPSTGVMGLAKDFKKSATVTRFAPDGTLERKWNLFGLYPTMVDPGSGSMESSDVVQISVEFSVDKVIYAGNATTGSSNLVVA